RPLAARTGERHRAVGAAEPCRDRGCAEALRRRLEPGAMSIRAELIRIGLRLCRARDDVPPDLAKIRRNGERIKQIVPKPPKGTKATGRTVGGVRAVAVATPRSLDGRHILYLHGGGFIFGSPSLYRDFIWRIVDAAGARALCLDYRLAPEHPFP